MNPVTSIDERLARIRQEAQGNPPAAEKLCAELTQSHRDAPSAWQLLGQLRVWLNKPAEAAAAFRQALQLRPNEVESLVGLAVSLSGSGQLEQAVAVFQQALAAAPNRAGTHYNLSITLAALGRIENALASVREAIRLDSGFVEAHLHLAGLHRRLGQESEAVQCYRAVLNRVPDHAVALCELGAVLTETRRPKAALVALRQSVRLNPQLVDAHNNLGLAQLADGQFHQAERSFEKALTLDPRRAYAHANMASAYKEQGRLEEALAEYDIAISYDPNDPVVHCNRALAMLQAGDYERGFAEYQWRFKRAVPPPRTFKQPMWAGRQLDGTVLIHAEQGLGDTIQFIRYAPLVKERVRRVIVECQEQLRLVFAQCDGIDEIVVQGTPLPAFDEHLPLLSAPYVFKTTLPSVPNRGAYLKPDEQRVEHWRKLVGNDGLKVGIAWQGNPRFKLDQFRSVPLTTFAPLARIKGLRLISLQCGPGAEQLDQPEAHQLHVLEALERRPADAELWRDIAALMATVDLVISTDNAIAHLAGAMARPHWLALGAAPDWRWMLGCKDSPWYSTMRIFRQKRLRHWRPVMKRIAAELARSVREPGHDPVPPSQR